MSLIDLEKLDPYVRIMRLEKPIGIGLLLWPTMWGLWLAYEQFPPLSTLIIFIIGTILMRSAGCVINDIADRNIDGMVERTSSRPLATGEISLHQALILFCALLLLSASLLLFLNLSIFKWAFIGAMLAIIYPFCKRFLATPQMILGFAFSWGIPIAFINAGSAIDGRVLALMLLNFLWIICYDTYYALVDMNDDIQIGVKSTAIFFGVYVFDIIKTLNVIIACLWLLCAYLFKLSGYFYFGYFIAHSLFIYQLYLASKKKREYYFRAFLNNNWYGMIMFLAIILGLA